MDARFRIDNYTLLGILFSRSYNTIHFYILNFRIILNFHVGDFVVVYTSFEIIKTDIYDMSNFLLTKYRHTHDKRRKNVVKNYFIEIQIFLIHHVCYITVCIIYSVYVKIYLL